MAPRSTGSMPELGHQSAAASAGWRRRCPGSAGSAPGCSSSSPVESTATRSERAHGHPVDADGRQPRQVGRAEPPSWRQQRLALGRVLAEAAAVRALLARRAEPDPAGLRRRRPPAAPRCRRRRGSRRRSGCAARGRAARDAGTGCRRRRGRARAAGRPRRARRARPRRRHSRPRPNSPRAGSSVARRPRGREPGRRPLPAAPLRWR